MEWINEFFDDSYLKMYEEVLAKSTDKEVDELIKILDIKPEHEILDVPCGYGRHSAELAKRGYSVTGLEYHPAQIERAKTYMKEKGAKFEIVQGDMRNLPFKNKFDRAFNHFTSFGYFTEEENEKTAGEFAKVLKPGGLFYINTINRDYILKIYQKSIISRLKSNAIWLQENEFNTKTSRNKTTHTLIETDGTITSKKIELRFYSPHELAFLLERNGFKVEKIYGQGEEEIDTYSKRIGIVARRI